TRSFPRRRQRPALTRCTDIVVTAEGRIRKNQPRETRVRRLVVPRTVAQYGVGRRLHAGAGTANARRFKNQHTIVQTVIFLPPDFLDRMRPCERERVHVQRPMKRSRYDTHRRCVQSRSPPPAMRLTLSPRLDAGDKFSAYAKEKTPPTWRSRFRRSTVWRRRAARRSPPRTHAPS